MADTSCSESDIGSKNGKDGHKELIVAGSKALLNNSPIEAAELYEAALDKMSSKSSQKLRILQVVVRYALCIAWINCNDKLHLKKASEILSELLEAEQDSKIPAIYLALAKIYISLKRFKKALDAIEKGFKVIRHHPEFKQYSWPGLQTPIKETEKNFLMKEFERLQKDCNNCPPPDAICRYEKCLEFSNNLFPSQEIYFTDPDFNQFILLQCDANCETAYHDTCSKNLMSNPKDFLGSPCSSNRCSNNGSIIVKIQVFGPDGFDNPIQTWQLKPETSNGSIDSAKSLNSQAKEPLHHADQPFIISSSLVSSLCSSQDDIRSEPFDNSQFDSLLEVLKECREIKFGYLDENNVNPELQCFGRPLTDHSTYVEPDEIDKADEAHADFVFSYYYSMFANNGPYKIDDLQETWKNTSDDLSLPESFTNKYPNLSEFLLKSERFAAIDDIIGTSDLLPDMFSKAEKELAESVSYFLFSQVIKPCTIKENKNQDFCTDISSSCPAVDPFKFNFVDDCKDSCVSEGDKDYHLCENSGAEIGNSNSKALPFNPNNIVSTTSFNGCLKLSSAPFVPRAVKTKSEVVYMSDDDEEIEVSLGDIDTEDNSSHNITNKVSPPSEEEIPVVSYTRSLEISQPELKNSSMQTDMITDPEKVNLLKEREILKKEVSELSYEKAELLQRLESLQIQIEANESLSANLRAQHTSALQQIQEKLLKKSSKVKELKELGSELNLEIVQLKERLEEKENQVIERENSLDKLRRSHAKEINNFVKTLQEKKLYKDEEYLKLWKDFCEFKIQKFNHLCNDRIIVLQKLKDMMSDTALPTKSDIKSSIEKYEEFIISATKKNAEVNEVYNREFERLKNGSPVKLPSVIEVPDISNMLYPPEGAFEYLLKPKQEEFAVPQNHFSPAFQSRFFPPSYGLNGSQTREQELQPQGHAGVASSSLFSHGLADVSNLWNNGAFPNISSTTPVVSPPGVLYDGPKANGPHLSIHQGFSPTNSMMPLQPPMNLLSNIMPYHPNSHSTAVQGFMGQNRTAPSPSLPFSSVNGSVFNASSVVGGGASVIQKPISSTPALSPTVKSTLQAVAPSTPVVAQGAIPKPRVQTATAALTPITPSKTTSRSVLKGSKSSESNYEKLMRNLQKMFPNRSDADLSQALKLAREKNGNSLSSLSHSEIVAKVEDVLNKHFRKHTSIGWEKFGQAAWGTAKPKVVEWEGAAQDECVICCEALHSKEVYTLECKHDFHKDCIKKWLNQESICPNCRKHSTMIDEFPPLG